jgi:hypothetical protein
MSKGKSFNDEFDLMERDDLLSCEVSVSNEILRLQNIIEKITYQDKVSTEDEKEYICSKLARKINYLSAKRNYIRSRLSLIKFKEKNKNVKISLERRKLALLLSAANSVLSQRDLDLLISKYEKLKGEDEKFLQLKSHFER